jgi:hypothetical protein
MHLAYFGLFIPFMVVRARMKLRKTEGPLPNRLRHFKATTLTLVMFATISLVVARVQWIQLFPLARPSLVAVMAGVFMLVTAVGLMRPLWRRAVQNRTRVGARVLHLKMPANASEAGGGLPWRCWPG